MGPDRLKIGCAPWHTKLHAKVMNIQNRRCARAMSQGDQHAHIACKTSGQQNWNTCSRLFGWTLLIHAALIMLPCMTLRLSKVAYISMQHRVKHNIGPSLLHTGWQQYFLTGYALNGKQTSQAIDKTKGNYRVCRPWDIKQHIAITSLQ